MDITVTRPFLPPLQEFQAYVEGIWRRNWLTNNGPLLNEYELRLKEYLDAEHLLFVTNGTIALQLAIKALNLTGEVITTPFSYVATTSSLVWEGCAPVMVDIDPETLNIDASRIEAAVTERTSGILATHVYGNPCDDRAIRAVATRHGLRVIYDAAHAFGTKVDGRSLLLWGDISVTSFHATKPMHSVEGGAVVTREPELLRKMALHRNFGHTAPESFLDVGINGKNSELHAAMGLCVLKYADAIVMRRKALSEYYDLKLTGLRVTRPKRHVACEYNYSYYPIVFESESALLKAVEQLNLHRVFPRRYFFPSLSTLPYVHGQSTPIAEDVSRRVLCLPLYHELSIEEIDMIVRILLRSQRYD